MAQRRDKIVRGVEVGSGVTAGTVGAALGAAKLRDAYREDFHPQFERAANSAAKHATEIAPRAGRLARVVSHGKPGGFIPLAVGGTAAATTAAAKKYRKHREGALVKADFGVKRKPQAGQGALRSIGRADDSVRRLRREVQPSSADVIGAVTVAGRRADAKVRAQMAKAYDPDRRRKRALQATSLGATVGAGVSAHSAVGEHRDARGRWASSGAASERSSRAFAAARGHEGQLDEQRAGMVRPVGSTGNVGASMRARVKEMDSMDFARRLRHKEGMSQFHLANNESRAARGALRRATGKTALAVGLGAGALAARQRAHSRDYR